MRQFLMIAGLAAVLATPSMASARSACDQRSHDRKVTGTVLGAVGGALIGNAVSRRNGAVIGGLGGAVVGNQLARTKCTSTYTQNRRHRAAYQQQASAESCRTVDKAFYDERGRLIYRPTRVCER